MGRSSFGAGFGKTLGAGCGCLVFVGLLLALWLGGCIAVFTSVSSPRPRTPLPTATRVSDDLGTKPKNEQKKAAVEPLVATAEKTERKKPKREPNRLTIENYYRIKDEMTYDQVKAILGPASEELSSSNIGAGTEFAVKTVMLTWKGSWGANTIITFQNGRVVAKAQVGLPSGDPTPDYVDPAAIEKQRQEEEYFARRKAELDAKQQAEQKRREDEEAAKWRTWSDTTGKYTIDAEFGGVANGVVTLKTREGQAKKVSLEKLSEEDRKWIGDRAK